MTKLLVLALAFTVLVAFASAHKTIITTTVDDTNPSSQDQCRQQLLQEPFNQCRMYFQQGEQDQGVEQCCNEIRNFDEQCQCAAMQLLFLGVEQQLEKQLQQGGRGVDSQQIQQLEQKARNLPNRCNLQVDQKQCQIRTTSNQFDWRPIFPRPTPQPRPASQQCRDIIIREHNFNQCQRYIAQELQQSGFLRTPLMIYRQLRQQDECCNELERVRGRCQCDAVQDVYRQAARGGGRRDDELEWVVNSLVNECNLEMRACRISASMF